MLKKFWGALSAIFVFTATSAVAGPNLQMRSYDIDRTQLFYDGWDRLPPDDWQPADADERLGLRLPYDWHDVYRNDFQRMFQPVVFYQNATALCNFDKANPDKHSKVSALYDELFDRMMEYATYEDDRLFIRSDFDFRQHTEVLPSGWVSAIVNGFAIAGIVNALDCFDQPRFRKALDELANAYKKIYRAGEEAPERWISYADENGYLWFDEYPLPNGVATRVLNGHIFGLFGLVLYAHKTGDRSFDELINAGITTMEDNVLEFRRKNKVNSYDLRVRSHPDYGPTRTVRQQCQLYAMTGVEFFRNVASTFNRDLKSAGIDVPIGNLRFCHAPRKNPSRTLNSK